MVPLIPSILTLLGDRGWNPPILTIVRCLELTWVRAWVVVLLTCNPGTLVLTVPVTLLSLLILATRLYVCLVNRWASCLTKHELFYGLTMPAALDLRRRNSRAPCVTWVEKLAGSVSVLLSVPARRSRARFRAVVTVLM